MLACMFMFEQRKYMYVSFPLIWSKLSIIHTETTFICYCVTVILCTTQYISFDYFLDNIQSSVITVVRVVTSYMDTDNFNFQSLRNLLTLLYIEWPNLICHDKVPYLQLSGNSFGNIFFLGIHSICSCSHSH